MSRAPGATAATDDPRLGAFRKLLTVGIFCHAYMWLATQMTEPFGAWQYPARWAWTPGVFFPVPLHFAIDWVGFLLAALYMGFGRRRRLGAGVLLGFALLHFMGLPERVPNHFLVIVVAVALLALSPRGAGAARELPLALLRLLCVLTYGFALLHKLNFDYFDLERSPVWVVDTLLRSLGLHDRLFHDPGFFRIGLWVSLLTELSLPWLLLWRRTRIFAILLGLVFHGVIAAADAPDYTGVILAFYVVFLDPDEFAAIAPRFTSPRVLSLVAYAGLSALGVAYSYIRSSEALAGAESLLSRRVQQLGLWLLLMAVLHAMACLLPFLLRGHDRWAAVAPPTAWSTGQRVGYGALLVAYSLNCLSPYLGLKMYFSQAMFSALAIDATNHYLLPPVKVLDNRGRFVELQWLSFSAAKAERQRPASVALSELLELQGAWIERNYLRSVLRHSCQNGVSPIGIQYREAGREILLGDACETDLPSYPLNLYPYAPRTPPAGFLADSTP